MLIEEFKIDKSEGLKNTIEIESFQKSKIHQF